MRRKKTAVRLSMDRLGSAGCDTGTVASAGALALPITARVAER